MPLQPPGENRPNLGNNPITDALWASQFNSVVARVNGRYIARQPLPEGKAHIARLDGIQDTLHGLEPEETAVLYLTPYQRVGFRTEGYDVRVAGQNIPDVTARYNVNQRGSLVAIEDDPMQQRELTLRSITLEDRKTQVLLVRNTSKHHVDVDFFEDVEAGYEISDTLTHTGMHVVTATHRGNPGMRDNNQDFNGFQEFSVRDNAHEGLVVAEVDGMGGQGDGRRAAMIGSTYLVSNAAYELRKGALPADALAEAAIKAQEALASDHELPPLSGFGFTLAALLNGQLTLLHMGDVHTHLLGADGSFATLGYDQRNSPSELRRFISKETAYTADELRFGVPNDPNEDEYLLQLPLPESRFRLLLCSDGMHGVIPDTDTVQPSIESILANTASPMETVHKLTMRSLAVGSPDNVSATLIQSPAAA